MDPSSLPDEPPVEPADIPETTGADSEPDPGWDFTSITGHDEDGALLGEEGVQVARRELGWGPKPAADGGGL